MLIQVLPAALVLVRSPVLQGAAVEALQVFFVALHASKSSTFDGIFKALLQTGQAQVRMGY